MRMITMGSEEITENINTGIDVLMNALLNDGTVDKETYETIMKHKVVVHEPNFFGRLFGKIVGGSDDLKISVVKIIGEKTV